MSSRNNTVLKYILWYIISKWKIEISQNITVMCLSVVETWMDGCYKPKGRSGGREGCYKPIGRSGGREECYKTNDRSGGREGCYKTKGRSGGRDATRQNATSRDVDLEGGML